MLGGFIIIGLVAALLVLVILGDRGPKADPRSRLEIFADIADGTIRPKAHQGFEVISRDEESA